MVAQCEPLGTLDAAYIQQANLAALPAGAAGQGLGAGRQIFNKPLKKLDIFVFQWLA
jgi:hypothetical protein